VHGEIKATQNAFKVIVFGPKLTLSLTHSLNTWSVGYIPIHYVLVRSTKWIDIGALRKCFHV
jgi:hypothetical protein